VEDSASSRASATLSVHIANGFTSALNPGVDNNVFYAGFSILK
jgi:hypothetical protein